MSIAGGTRFGPYEIVSSVGAGGMGEVYRARDTRLNREVAIKVLPPALTQDPERLSRFHLEAKAASALNHPNIAVIFDIGEQDGQPFLVMELLEGCTLRERIALGPLPVDELLDLAIQISDALDAAHAKRILHRDIKPANLFLTDRHQVKILDFGLAKVASSTLRGLVATAPPTASFASEEHLTSPGMALGTVAYMSPEQARGGNLDGRSDLFSFGAVLYEMATQRLAFPGETSAVVFAAILNRAPVVPAGHPDLPAKLVEIISKLLEKDVDFRYQTAAEVRADLKRLKRDLESSRSVPAPAAKPSGPSSGGIRVAGKALDSLAVLPFENASGDPANDYLTEGITETIINSLSKLPKVRVVPRGMVMRYKAKTDDIVTAANELNVRAIVTGRVLQHKDTLIVKAELVDVARQNQVWGDQYNRKLADLLEVQNEIAGEIARHLQEKLGGSSAAKKPAKSSPARPAVDPEAYRLYLQGVHQSYQWKQESMRLSIETFQKAINIDPSYAPCYAGLAYTLAMVGFYGFIPPKQAYAQSRAAAEKALSIDPTLAEAHVALGWVELYSDRDAEASFREFHKAIELKPDLAIAHHGLALQLTVMQRFEEALAEILKAVAADPLTALFQAHHGWILHTLGRDLEALRVLQAAQQVNPNDYYILRILLYTCKPNNRPDLALTTGRKCADMSANPEQKLAIMAFACTQAGESEEARKLLRELLASPNIDTAAGFYMAMALTALGDCERALDWLEKLHTDGMGIVTIIKAEPTLKPVWAHPRFIALVNDLGIQKPRT